MRIRDWAPAGASDREIESGLAAFNRALAADLPREPPWSTDHLRDYLAVTMPDERRLCFVAEAAGTPIGFASVLLLGYDAAGTAVIELFTDPAHRRRGVGSALLAAVTRRAADEGLGLLTVEVVGDTAAVPFYRAHGFGRTVVEHRGLLDLATVDWDRIAALSGRLAANYRLEPFPDNPTDDLLTAYAEAKLVVRESPLSATEWNAPAEAHRIAESLRTLRARGLRPHVTLAIHEKTGDIAGLTEIVVPAQRPQRADQYDTLVVPAHRGYGLGLAMKARMLQDLRTTEPQVTSVQTWQAIENEPMLRVNDELGFHVDREWHEYEAEIATLRARLPA